MRFASCIPWSKLTPGRTWDSAAATPSKVLWLSLRTITRQAPPVPVPPRFVGLSFVGVAGATVVIAAGRRASPSLPDASACFAFATVPSHTRRTFRLSLQVGGGGGHPDRARVPLTSRFAERVGSREWH